MLESASKLMYYPTHKKEIYKIVSLLGVMNPLSVVVKEKLISDIGKEKFRQEWTSVNAKTLEAGKVMTSDEFLYNYLIEQEKFDIINEHFKFDFGYSSRQMFSILDPFAGEGEWLSIIKRLSSNSDMGTARLHTIANELERNRYLKCKGNKYIDESYQGSFEDLGSVPKNSVSLLLYNPPYGDTNGVRNARHYLQMVLDKEIMFRPQKSDYDYNSRGGLIVMVLRKDDLIGCADLIIKNFIVHNDFIYKVHDEEYDRYKQMVLIASLKRHPFKDTNPQHVAEFQYDSRKLVEILNNEPEFKGIGMYTPLANVIPSVPYEEMKENYTMTKEHIAHKSDLHNSNWDWARDLTTVARFDNTKITKPTPPTVGEIANIIASGMINGEIRADKGSHIVTGGIKNLEKTEHVTELDRNGKKVDLIKTTKYSEPYLNILIRKNGKTIVKEIMGDG